MDNPLAAISAFFRTLLEYIARFGVVEEYRAGADMDAETLAGATTVDRRIDWAGTADRHSSRPSSSETRPPRLDRLR
jgi:hypothetical protein